MTCLAMIAAFDMKEPVQEHNDLSSTSQALFATSAALSICSTLKQKPSPVERPVWLSVIHQAYAWMHTAFIGTAPKVQERKDLASIYTCSTPQWLVCDVHPLPVSLLVFFASLLFSTAVHRTSLPVALAWSICAHVSSVLIFQWLRRHTHAQYQQYCEQQALPAGAHASGSGVPKGYARASTSKRADVNVEGAACARTASDAQGVASTAERGVQPQVHTAKDAPVSSGVPAMHVAEAVHGHSTGTGTHRPATADECLVAGAGIAVQGLAEHASSSQAKDQCMARYMEESAVLQRMRPYRSRCARTRVNITLCGPAPDTLPPGALDDLLRRLSSSCGADGSRIMSDVAVRAGCVVLSVSLLGQLDAVATAEQIAATTNEWAHERRVALEGGTPISVQLNDGRRVVCLPHQAFLLGVGFNMHMHTPSVLLPHTGSAAHTGSCHSQPQPQPQPRLGVCTQPGREGMQECAQAAGVGVELCVRVSMPEGVGAGPVLGWLGPEDSPEEEEGEEENGRGYEGMDSTGCAKEESGEQGRGVGQQQQQQQEACERVVGGEQQQQQQQQQERLQLRLLGAACGGFLPLRVLGMQRCGCDNVLDVQVHVTLPPNLPLPSGVGAPLTFQLFHRSALLCTQSALLLPPSLAPVHEELQQLVRTAAVVATEEAEQAGVAAEVACTEGPGSVTGTGAAAGSHPQPQHVSNCTADFVADLADWMQFCTAQCSSPAATAAAAAASPCDSSGESEGQAGAGVAAAVGEESVAMMAGVGADLLCHAVATGLVNLADLLLSCLLSPPFSLPFPALALGSCPGDATPALAPTPLPITPPTAAPTQRPLGWSALVSGSVAMLARLLDWGHTLGGPGFTWCWKEVGTSAPSSEDECADDTMSSTLALEHPLPARSNAQHAATAAALRNLCARCELRCEPGCQLPRVLAVLACAAGPHAAALLGVLQHDPVEGPRLARAVRATQHAQRAQQQGAADAGAFVALSAEARNGAVGVGVGVDVGDGASHAAQEEQQCGSSSGKAGAEDGNSECMEHSEKQQLALHHLHTPPSCTSAPPKLSDVCAARAESSPVCAPLSAHASSVELESAASATPTEAAGTSTGHGAAAPGASGSSGLRRRPAAAADAYEATCTGSSVAGSMDTQHKHSTLSALVSSPRWEAWREAARCSLWGFHASTTAARWGGASEAGYRAWCTAFAPAFVMANLVLLSVGTYVGAIRAYMHGSAMDGVLIGLVPGTLFAWGLLSIGRPYKGAQQKASVRAGKWGHFLLWTLMGLKVIPINYASRLLLATYTEAAVALFASPVIVEQARPQSMLPERLYTSLMYGMLYASSGNISYPLVRTLAVNLVLWAIEWLLHMYIMRTYLAHLATPIPRPGQVKPEKAPAKEVFRKTI